MELPESLNGKEWTPATARRMFPLLVWCAQNGVTITYGQLDKELQRRGWGDHVMEVKYGSPAGAVGDACQEMRTTQGERIPPLNAILVNAKSGIPGTGADYYLASYLGKRRSKIVTDVQRKAMAEETMEEVWQFQKWDSLLKRYGFKPLKGGIPSLRSKNSRRERQPERSWSNEAESKQHKALKKWVSKNPDVLGHDIPYSSGKIEWQFASADRVDVLFKHKKGCAAVEVKASNANLADLERGIYQCVKYRALLRAELKAEGKIPNGLSILVTEKKLPPRLRVLADLHRVPVIVVPVNRA